MTGSHSLGGYSPQSVKHREHSLPWDLMSWEHSQQRANRFTPGIHHEDDAEGSTISYPSGEASPAGAKTITGGDGKEPAHTVHEKASASNNTQG